jgi:hypothetical protein
MPNRSVSSNDERTVAMLSRKTAEETEADRQRKEDARAEAARSEQAAELERQRQAYLASPQGQARTAFERGYEVFQASFGVMSQQAVVVAMADSPTTKQPNDPTAILNCICREGWELVTGSFVYVEGKTVGYYLFVRCEANWRKPDWVHTAWRPEPI